MTSITPTTTTTTQPTTTQSTTSSATSVISSDFETFLVMLTTQMENQDPLNPMDSSEYAVQLATFSSVEQQVRTNDLLTQMMAQDSASGMAQMADWVGNQVRVQAPAIYEGQPITISPSPAPTASSAALVVRDSSGTERYRMAIPVSETPVEWAGADANGNSLAWGTYAFSVESFDQNGDVVGTSTPQIYSDVVEARIANGGIDLVLSGGTIVDASSVTAVRSGN